jgi:hypothetical protein
MDGGRRMWSALCGFEPLPHEVVDISQIRGADRGVMKLVCCVIDSSVHSV